MFSRQYFVTDTIRRYYLDNTSFPIRFADVLSTILYYRYDSPILSRQYFITDTIRRYYLDNTSVPILLPASSNCDGHYNLITSHPYTINITRNVHWPIVISIVITNNDLCRLSGSKCLSNVLLLRELYTLSVATIILNCKLSSSKCLSNALL